MGLLIKEKVALATYTTLHIGGVADYLAEVTSVEALQAALLFAKEKTALPPLILGGGSNVLVSDEGYRGLVIVMRISGRHFVSTSDTEVTLTCGAGEVLDEVIEDTTAKNLWGLENLSSIPGTVGATPVQNVGAYGVEIASLVTEVFAVNKKTFLEKKFSNQECFFDYRNSFFKTEAGKEWIVTAVTFLLQKNFSPVLTYGSLQHLETENLLPAKVRAEVQMIRSEKFPDWSVVGTAGSFFKNPIITKEHFSALTKHYSGIVGYELPDDTVKVSLGWVLDKVCDLRGHSSGPVSLYEHQALVLVVQKTATAEQVKNFVTEIEKKVFEKTKIKIEREVLYV